ncbi:DUF4398 domain-containing protein [Dokdonella soli]|uniref:DUF4398 domain-containing protein n=1 Tax=Dokdonella soli TaxID=529810 RepID=A0ABN1IIJ0_9GAMM
MAMQLMTPRWRKIHALVVVIAALSVQACAPTRPPVEDLDNASRALGAARSAGAPAYAPAEYRAAGQRFDQAQAAEGRQDYDEAIQLAHESAADSELAAAKARLGKAREAVQKLSQENANLDRDLTEHASPEAQP